MVKLDITFKRKQQQMSQVIMLNYSKKHLKVLMSPYRTTMLWARIVRSHIAMVTFLWLCLCLCITPTLNMYNDRVDDRYVNTIASYSSSQPVIFYLLLVIVLLAKFTTLVNLHQVSYAIHNTINTVLIVYILLIIKCRYLTVHSHKKMPKCAILALHS